MKTINLKKTVIFAVVAASAVSFIYLNSGLAADLANSQDLIQASSAKFSDVTIVKHFLEKLLYTFASL